jgi:hypothetical protein
VRYVVGTISNFDYFEHYADWEAYEARLGPTWSGSRTQYTLEESSRTVEIADMLLMEMKRVYNPVFDEDLECMYVVLA